MTIEERLENMERELERQKRRNRWMLSAIVLVAGGLIVPLVFETTPFRAQAQEAGTAKEVRANSFVLEDEKGMVRAGLEVTKDGPFLALLGENGEPRVLLDVTNDCPRLLLLDKNGKTRTELTVLKDGPSLRLCDEKGMVRGALGVLQSGLDLVLFGPDGKVIWSAIK